MLSDLIANYAEYEYFIATAQLVLAMLGMGALLAPADFILEVKRPRGLLVGLSSQWLLVPLVAFALGSLLSVPAGIAAGMILLASVPGGTMSNIYTLFARGNIALSISLTSITTVAALLMSPLILQVLLAQYLPDDFNMPTGRIALDIFGALILPLLVGMWIRHSLNPRTAVLISKWSIRLSLLAIVVMVVGASGSGRLDPEAYGLAGIGALVLFFVCVQAVVLLAGRVTGMGRQDTVAVLIETGYRNVSLAVAIKAVVFPAQSGVLDPIGDAVLFTIFIYGGISMVLSLIPVFVNRRLTPPEDSAAVLKMPS